MLVTCLIGSETRIPYDNHYGFTSCQACRRGGIMNIVVFEAEDWDIQAFDTLADSHALTFIDEPLTQENASRFADAEIVSIFVNSRLSAEALRRMPRLKLVTTRSTGFDHIDVDYCQGQDIQVANVPSYGQNTVAEHVFGLLLSISHHLYAAFRQTRHGDFSTDGLEGFDLKGKTIGVIGVGDIGRHVIRIAKGFGMQVLAFDMSPDERLAEQLEFVYCDMPELLANSDVVTPHVPANEKTYHLIDAEAFRQMKDGVVLINTARGSVVDEQALLAALSEGKVSAAGLDVLAEEDIIREEKELVHSVAKQQDKHATLLANHVLLRMENVFVTPHTAFNTREARQRILDTTLDNIHAFLNHQAKNLVRSR